MERQKQSNAFEAKAAQRMMPLMPASEPSVPHRIEVAHMRKHAVSVALLSLVFFTAPALAEDVVQLSPDTYMISRTSHAGMFANMSKLKATVIREANAFAERQGKIAIPISAHDSGMIPGQFPYFEYQFRVVPKDDPEAKRTALVPRADVVVEKSEHITADVHTKDDSEKQSDLYAELLKLDDLRKRGILTDEEFAAQKRKLLGNSK